MQVVGQKITDAVSVIRVQEATNKLHDSVLAKWGADHWDSMKSIVTSESGFEPCKINGGAVDCNYKGPKACGLAQALPCQKLLDKCGSLDNIPCQVEWVVNYVVSHGYGTPNKAWIAWNTPKCEQMVNGSCTRTSSRWW